MDDEEFLMIAKQLEGFYARRLQQLQQAQGQRIDAILVQIMNQPYHTLEEDDEIASLERQWERS